MTAWESGDKRNLDSISKQGTSIGRKVLYQAVKCMVSASKFNPNHIADYYQTKKWPVLQRKRPP